MPGFQRPVFILGAGATKACGGPLTNEILPWVFRTGPDSPLISGDREMMLSRLGDFLQTCFCVPRGSPDPKPTDFPDLPLLMSVLDDAIDRGHQFGDYTTPRLREVRGWLAFAIAEVIKWSLEDRVVDGRTGLRSLAHEDLLGPFYARALRGGERIEPTVVSFNFDLIVDNAMVRLGEPLPGKHFGALPDYCCDVATEAYRKRRDDCFGRLLKPHGSLNWMFCPACKQLDLFYGDGKLPGSFFAKAIPEFWAETGGTDPYSCKGTPCRRGAECKGEVAPVLITPTQAKDYRNPHITRVWYETERALQRADRVVIVG